MGPDHSSARIGRALELVNDITAIKVNLEVANCVIPSNYYHLLMRQMHRNFRRPLILGTPKSGLRNKLAFSDLDNLGPGTSFQPFILNKINAGSDVLLICNGKIYFDLFQQLQNENVTILLLEELSPFPFEELKEALKTMGSIKKAVFVQEEHENGGIFRYLEPTLRKLFQNNLNLVSRPGLSSSAIGNSADYKKTQDNLYKSIISHIK